jgi:hypothetical protein
MYGDSDNFLRRLDYRWHHDSPFYNRCVQVANVSLHVNLLDLDVQRLPAGRVKFQLECLPWHVLICKTSEEQSSRLRSLLSLISCSDRAEVCVPLIILESVVVDLALAFEREHGVCLTQVQIVCGELAVSLDEHLAWLQLQDRVPNVASPRSNSVGSNESQYSKFDPLPREHPASLNLLEEEVLRTANKLDPSEGSASRESGESPSVVAAVQLAAGAVSSTRLSGESPGQERDTSDSGRRGFRLPNEATFKLPLLKVSWAHASLDHVLESGFTGLHIEAKGTQADLQAGSSGLLDIHCQCGAFEVRLTVL